MRITSQMMINTNMADIQTNKLLLNKYNTQMSTQKKINRPSEDPVIAIRALRLRSSLNQVSMYLDKNIPDASSWLDITEGALDEGNSIITQLYGYCTQGATDSYSSEQRQTIAETLNKLKEAFYAEGDVEYAGRYVFTGYKTDTPLTYQSNDTAKGENYTITQDFDRSYLTTKKAYTNSYSNDDIMNLNLHKDENGNIVTPNVETVHTIRTAYRDVNETGFKMTYNNTDISVSEDGTSAQITTYQLDANGDILLDDNGDAVVAGTTTVQADADGKFTFNDSTGVEVKLGMTADDNTIPEDNEIIFNGSTGEILLGKDIYSNVYTSNKFSMTYIKDNFEKGDLNPTMYFNCIDNNTGIEYEKKDEAIEYNINYSQKLKINTQADEAFDIYLGRDIDGLVKSVNDVLDIEAQITQVKSMMEEERYRDDTSQSTLNSILEGLNKQYDFAKDNMTKSFENGVKQMQSYQQKNSVAKADVGNRETRLTLTKSRVTEQKTNFKSLKSNNEDIDLEEVVIGYASAELVYNASLSAASKVVQQTLLDFIR